MSPATYAPDLLINEKIIIYNMVTHNAVNNTDGSPIYEISTRLYIADLAYLLTMAVSCNTCVESYVYPTVAAQSRVY